MTDAKDDVQAPPSPDLEDVQARLSSIEDTLSLVDSRKSFLPAFIRNRVFASASVAVIGILAGLVLGIGIFLLIKGVQWRGALSDLRAEPGIQIMSVHSLGPLKKQVFGLRDPLAPNPHKFLQKHNISANRVDFQLAEYHSLNTPYSYERDQERGKELAELRGKVISVVGTLSEENRALRENELGKISQLLLEMRFPEAMKKLNLKYDDGVWHADGQLLTNEYLEFRAQAPKYILNGAVDLDNIGNYTQAKSESLITGIQAANLLDTDYTGEYVHIPRLARLIREYDALCLNSGTTPGRIKLHIESNDPSALNEKSRTLADKLAQAARIVEARVRLISSQAVRGKTVKDRIYIEIDD